jgi:voltage-gated potassium channel
LTYHSACARHNISARSVHRPADGGKPVVAPGASSTWYIRAALSPALRPQVRDAILSGTLNMPPFLLPPVLIGGGLVVVSFGLLWRSRIAWNMAFLLLATGTISKFFFNTSDNYIPEYYPAILSALAFYWKKFDRASIAASTLFALTSVAMAITYATFGSYHLGSQFKPEIDDLITALYYAMVTMSTVGYGDIIPQTSEAKLFVVSLMVLGIATFATSLTAVLAPLVSSSLQRIVKRGESRMRRDSHFVVIGNTPLAVNV